MQSVRLTPELNMEIWRKGIRHVPHKVRIVAERKSGENDTWTCEVDVDKSISSFDGLTTQKIE